MVTLWTEYVRWSHSERSMKDGRTLIGICKMVAVWSECLRGLHCTLNAWEYDQTISPEIAARYMMFTQSGMSVWQGLVTYGRQNPSWECKMTSLRSELLTWSRWKHPKHYRYTLALCCGNKLDFTITPFCTLGDVGVHYITHAYLAHRLDFTFSWVIRCVYHIRYNRTQTSLRK